MRKEFVVNIFLLVLINLIVKPAYLFGIEARVQDLVGTEAYGLYFSLFNFVFLFQFINDPGLQTWNAQFVPKNRENIARHLGHLTSTKLILGFIFISLVLLAAYVIGYKEKLILILIAVNLILSSVFMLIRSNISGLGFYKIDSFLSTLDKLLMIFIIGYFVWFSPIKEAFSIYYFLLAQMISITIAVVLAALILIKRSSFTLPKLKASSIIYILRQTAPYVLTMIFMTAYNKLDGVMLGYWIDDNNYQAGVYASAYRFYDAANMIGYLFAALLLPMFAANMFEKETLWELQSLGLRYAALAAIIVVFVLVFYGPVILPMLYSDYEPQFYQTLKFLIFGYLAMAIGYIYGTLLVATGKVRRVNAVYAFGLVVNILLNIILIPWKGALGAAVAAVITQTIVLLGQIVVVKRELGIFPYKEDVFKLLLYFLLSYSTFYAINSIFNLHWVLSMVVCVLICLLLPFPLRVVRLKELALLVNKEV